MKHTLHCVADHEKNDEAAYICPVCNGGLSSCKLCHGTESCLPAECPGRPLSESEKNRITRGRLEFVSGKWWIPLM